MKYALLTAVTAALVCASASALADEVVVTPPPVVVANPHPWRIGFGMDLGVPSGVSLGVVVHPKVDWLSVEGSFTENVLSPGGRLSVKFDPLVLATNFPIGVIADLQGGFFGRGSLPGHSDLPSIGYDYVNLYGGFRFGRAQNFHWLIEAGPSYLSFNSNNFQSVVKSSSVLVGNPTVTGWVTPTFVTGFEVVWP
jgi:hypothetical protein